jgi:hypothetical protein
MRWAELRMCRFWAGGISSFPFSRAREYRLLRRLLTSEALKLLSSRSRMSHYACWPTRCTAEWLFCYWSLFSVAEVWSLKSEVWSPKSDVWSPKSEVWSPKSEVRSPKSEVWSLKSLHGFRIISLPILQKANIWKSLFSSPFWVFDNLRKTRRLRSHGKFQSCWCMRRWFPRYFSYLDWLICTKIDWCRFIYITYHLVHFDTISK